MKMNRNDFAALALTGAVLIMPLNAGAMPLAGLSRIEDLSTVQLVQVKKKRETVKQEVTRIWRNITLAGAAWAQTQPGNKNADKPEYPTGRTVTPEIKGQSQPQGSTGPIDTTTGGAPASSAQGDSPPGMQAAPDGSSKTTVAPGKDKKDTK